jgi:GAF domain-containing protein
MPLRSWQVDAFRTVGGPEVTAPARVAAVRATGLLDSPPEELFDRVVGEASARLDAPAALLTVVAEDRQFFKAALGVPDEVAAARGTPLDHSICQYTVRYREPVAIPDVRRHPELHERLTAAGLDVASYAGAPLRLADGEILGALCVLDAVPRQWTEEDVEQLEAMAATVVDEIERRR